MKKAIIVLSALGRACGTPCRLAEFGDDMGRAGLIDQAMASVIRVRKPGFFGWPFAEKPTGLTVIKSAFKTRTEAENSMKTTKICSSG